MGWDRKGLSLVAGAFAALACAGCATVEQNYLGPGPAYTGQHADGTRPRREVRVVTFNIEYGLRTPAAIDALKAHAALRDPDVLLLQEMDAPGVAAVAEALALNYAYYPSSRTPKTHRDVGTAVLSPWPIERRPASPGTRAPSPRRTCGSAAAWCASTASTSGRPSACPGASAGTSWRR
jgi:hypothetical protein